MANGKLEDLEYRLKKRITFPASTRKVAYLAVKRYLEDKMRELDQVKRKISIKLHHINEEEEDVSPTPLLKNFSTSTSHDSDQEKSLRESSAGLSICSSGT